MAYRIILGHRAAIRSLTSSLKENTSRVVEGAVRVLGPFTPEGVGLPDLAVVFQTLLNLLHDAASRINDAGWQRRDEGTVDSKARRKRDEAAKGLRAKVQHVSNCIWNALGDDGLETVGLDKGIEPNPIAMLDQVIHMDRHLRDPALLAGEVRVGITLDPVALADSLEPEKSSLSDSLDTLTDEERATETALLEKDATVREVRRLYVAAAKVIEGFYRLAGLGAEADRLRLNARRRNAEDEPVTEEASSEGSDVADVEEQAIPA